MKTSEHKSGKLWKKPKSIGGAILILLLALLYNVFLAEEPLVDDGNLIPVELVRTIDGDTIKIRYEGKEQNVRYLLIDTPELDHEHFDHQPFAEEATKRNDELLKGGQVQIEFDIGDREDKYGRLLAYVYVDGESVQQTLLEEGLARVAYIYKPNTMHVDLFKKAEGKASEAGLGIWSIEGYVTNRGFKSAVY